MNHPPAAALLKSLLLCCLPALWGCAGPAADPGHAPPAIPTAAAAPPPAPAPLPDPPAILKPQGVWMAGEAPLVSFSPVAGASHYRLEASPGADFGGALETYTVPGDAAAGSEDPVRIFLRTPLDPCTSIHIRLAAALPDGRTTTWRTLQIDGILPAPSALPVEPSSDALLAQRPTLRWNPVPGAGGYELEVAAAGGSRLQALAAAGAAAASLALPEPLPGSGDYTFRVRAVTPSCRGAWSADAAFTIPRRAPRLAAPLAEARVSADRPLFRWQPGEEEERLYELEIAPADAAAAPPPPATFSGLRGLACRLPAALARGARYRARIRPARVQEGAAWSDPVVFEILAERPDPYRVAALATGSGLDRTHPAVSPDGLHLAVLARAPEDPAPGSSRLLAFQWIPGAAGGEPKFQAVPEPARGWWASHRIRHAAWTGGPGRPPALLAAALIAEGGSHSPGGIWRLEAGGAGFEEISPAGFGGPADCLSFPRLAADPRIYFASSQLSPHPGLAGAPSPHPGLAGANPAPAGAGADAASGLAPAVFSPQREASAEAARAPRMAEIWSMRPDGTDLRMLGIGADPAISPDGRTLVSIAAGEPGNADPEMRLLFLDESGRPGAAKAFPSVRQPAVEIRSPVWSPRGNAIAFARDRGDGFDIIVADVATGRETAVTQSYGNDLDPAFLPDASRESGYRGILFASDRAGGTWGIYWADY